MDNKDLLEEIRMVREDIKELQKEFFVFKGKSLGFISILTFIASFVVDYIKGK